jgi:hypothetical protein
LALLSTTLKPRRAAAMRFGLKQGESVAAFGYPYADVLASSGNFTLGNVTALAQSSNAAPRDPLGNLEFRIILLPCLDVPFETL